MNSPDVPDAHAGPNGQVLSTQVAELAGEMTEAQHESSRQRIARQISDLASRSGQAAWHGTQAGAGAAWHGTQAGAGAAWNAVQSGANATAARAKPAREAAVRQAAATGGAAVSGAQAGSGAVSRGVRSAGGWLAGQAVEMAPKVPIRSNETLRAQHPGMDTEQIAEQLIAGAARTSMSVGATIGTAAAVPFVPTMPVELGVETLALVAIELKLVAELHEIYGQPAPSMLSYLRAWSQRRGVRLTGSGLTIAVGSPVRRQLERRLLAKASKSALSLAPLLAGAAAGAAIDYRETRRLGNVIRDDLRKSKSTALVPTAALEPGQTAAGQVAPPPRRAIEAGPESEPGPPLQPG